MSSHFQPVYDFVKNLRQDGSFARNFTIAFSGNTVAILVGFLFTPFIARIYTPEAYGFFALYASISQNVAVIATLQLPKAFVLPESELEFKKILNAATIAMMVIVILSGFVLVLFGNLIFSYFDIHSGQTNILVYLIPLSVLLYSINDIFKSWNVRKKFFTKNALTQILSSTSARGVTLGYGIATSGNSAGLILGDLIAKTLENFFLGGKIVFKEFSRIFSGFSSKDFLNTLKKYRSYPFFLLPGVWIQSVITQFPVYFALLFFDSASAGYYSFANSLLNMPVSILAGAMAPVFLQKASETFRTNTADMGRIVKGLADKLFFMGLFPMVFLIVFGDYIFAFVLGDQWVTSGVLASYMGIYFLFLILNYPLVSIYRIYKKEYVSLLTNILALVLTAAALSIGLYYNDFLLGIALFSGANVIYYLLNILIIFNLTGLPSFRIIFTWLIYSGATLGIFLMLRRFIEGYIL